MTATTDQAWFTHDRFGMFIHWGVYALGARHEWLMNRERMTVEQYERYAGHFDPDLFDAREWAAAAKAAGCRCIAVTTSFPAERLREAGADAICADIAGVWECLQQL